MPHIIGFAACQQGWQHICDASQFLKEYVIAVYRARRSVSWAEDSSQYGST